VAPVWPEPCTITIAGPLTVFGMRYWTYIWLMVIWPGCEMPPTAVPGWVDCVSWPLTKKLPSSCSSSGPPSDPAIVIPPVASSRPSDKPAMVSLKLRSMLVMTASLS
jgi:hypothetical protein